MIRKYRHFPPLLLAVALALPLVTTGCAEHRYYRVYDPHYRDYHRWDDHEVVLQPVDGRNPSRPASRLSQVARRREEGILELAAQPR